MADAYKDLESQNWEDIALDETTVAIKKSSYWKSPGTDGVPNFWINNLHATHEDLTRGYNKAVKHPHNCPAWFTVGVTYLLPKSEDTKNPKNYRPTCLPTMFYDLDIHLRRKNIQFS